ncbi:MAG: NAD(P)/FAD-dependent oxidoreductase [Chloroflexi bacterium]|nr:NAD(P)/FAD-dependent oxidoreductase [Chloroflexota bacterium]
MNTQNPVVVIGGGLAGLTAANYLARAGKQVIVLERAKHLGGRARTNREHGFEINFGPHALYLKGAGARVLRELNLLPAGSKPIAPDVLLAEQQLYPTKSIKAALTIPLLNHRAKWQFLRTFAKIPFINPANYADRSFAQWIEQQADEPHARQLLAMFGRLTTYGAANDLQSAAATLENIKTGLAGVLYVDHGWQVIVESLINKARQAGVELRTSQRVQAIQPSHAGVTIQLADGTTMQAEAVVLAVTPQAANELVGTSQHFQRHYQRLLPITAACLDVGLRQLPQPQRRFLLGVDQPYYAVAHSSYAKLATPGQALIHVMKYLDPRQTYDPKQTRAELEQLLDQYQAGWRDQLITSQFLPSITVSYDTPQVQFGGLAGRTPVVLDDCPNVYLAGDWVGTEGQLADASFASGYTAAKQLLQPATQSQMRSIGALA